MSGSTKHRRYSTRPPLKSDAQLMRNYKLMRKADVCVCVCACACAVRVFVCVCCMCALVCTACVLCVSEKGHLQRALAGPRSQVICSGSVPITL